MDNTENTAVFEAEDISDGAELDTEKDDTSFEEEKFEYDENGDVIIPEIEQTSEDDEEVELEVDEETSEQSDGEESEDTEETEENSDVGDNEAEGASADGGDTKGDSRPESKQDIKAPVKSEREGVLEKRLAKIESLVADVLGDFEYDTSDAYEALLKFGADNKGKTVDNYRQDRAQTENSEQLQREARATAFNQKMAKDLSDIQSSFPETKNYTSITEIPNFRRFAELSDKGLTAKEAYAAANPDAIRAVVAKAVKKQSLADTKSHLRPVTSKSAKDKSVSMKKSELNLFRDLFDGELSDREIAKLYKDTAN